MINLSRLLNESYYDSLSDDEQETHASSYFDIGQDEEDSKNNFCWIWNGNAIIAKKGGTHGFNFSHDVADRNFKGWYDVDKNKISVVFPKSEIRKLGDKRPTVDDIPQRVYKALTDKFGFKKNPLLVVFESINENSESGKPFIKAWMDPVGEFHIADSEGHVNWVKKYLISVNEEEPVAWAYDIMYKKGWVRISYRGNEIHMEYDKPGSLKVNQYRKLKDFAIEEGASLYDDVNNRYIIKSEKSVDENTYSEGSSLIPDDKIRSSWMDPSGKIHPIRNELNYGHQYWAENYLDSLNVPLESSVYHQMFKMGFIRIAVIGNVIHIDYERGCIKNSNIREIKNIAIEQNLGLFDDVINKYILENGKEREEVFESLKLIDILSENYNPVNSWMDQDCKIHPVGQSGGHIPWAKNYISEHNIDLGSNSFITDSYIYNKMFSLGFVRLVHTSHNFIYVEYSKRKGISRRQTEELVNIGIENEINISDTISGKPIHGNVDLNESLNLVDILSENGVLGTDTNHIGAWMGPDNKIYPVDYKGHLAWAAKYIKDHDIDLDGFENDIYTKMFGLGFIRIVKLYDKAVAVEYHIPYGIRPNQLKELRNLGIENGITIQDATARRYITKDGKELDESIKLMDILHESSTPITDSWFGPDNKLHSVSGYIHVTWARKYLKSIGFEDSLGYVSVYQEMFKRGFVRVSGGTTKFHIEYSKERGIKPSQLRELKNIAIEHGLSLYDDITVRYIYERNREDLDESVNYTDRVEDSWFGPDNKLHSIQGKIHATWARDFLQKLGVPTSGPTFDVYGEMYKRGFIRVKGGANQRRGFNIEYSKERGTKPSQLRELRNIAIETRSNLFDDMTHKYIYTVDEEIEESSSRSREPSKIGNGWMDPEAKIHRLETSHVAWGRKYLTSKNPNFEGDNVSIYGEMYKLGFIRIHENFVGDTINIDYDRSIGIKPKQLKELKDLCIENGLRLMDDVIHKCYIGNGGSEINESLNLTKILSESKVERQFIYDFWFGPDCKMYRLDKYETHVSWAKRYLSNLKPPVKFKDSSEIYERMFNLGFIRGAGAGEPRDLYLRFNPDAVNPKQLKELKDFSIEMGVEMHDDASAWYRIARRGLTETENSDEIKEESDMTDGWMDKNAVFHSLDGHSHVTWAEEYLEHNRIPVDIHNTYEQMFRLGFVRVRTVSFSGVIHFEYSSGHHILPKQKKELIDLALENRLDLFDNVRDEDIVKDGQIV